MAKEIERKFLVSGDSFRSMARSAHRIAQGYLSTNPEATVRVRLYDDHGFITVKGLNHGIRRDEWEYEIPVDDARAMLALCGTTVLSKVRYAVDFDGLTWEVDEFDGRLSGLIVAEVELPDENCRISLPQFVGREVSGDIRYYNSCLASASELPPTR